ncbi:19070_t:CDS:2 [Cetraspora pellucida]|uniref:19070_t:CDS:1 n=1 Tax=Cetraspora pellucida TaxID=1433469 RepID=A0A9N9G596_9GLOM|nr:19070_t:CDS:2 [Cetraspora pellucida]
MTTISSLPDDILYIISKDLGFLSTLALRSTCRTLYLSFSDAVTFSHVFIPPSISHDQFAKLFSHLKSTNKLPFIHQFTFNNSQIKADEVISVLENCENLQELYILGCKESYNIDTISTISATMSNMMPAVLMSNSVNIYTNVNLTNPIACNKNNNEKNDANDGIFQFQSCSDLSCELCTQKCAGCNTKYKYWDEFWIKCGWCKDRHFCGGCVIEASKKNVFKTYAFQFMRIKLCQMFDLPCPH